MIVDGLIDGLALLESLDVLVHELKVLGLKAQRRDVEVLAASAVMRVVVIKADDGRHVADQSVAVRVAACPGGGVGYEASPFVERN